MDIPLIAIEVTPDIAKTIRFMAESGIFALKGASATLNFAPNGELKTVKTEHFFYAPKGVDNSFALPRGAILGV